MNISDKNQDFPLFKLTNFYLACFLFVKGLELLDIEEDPTNSRRSLFIFKDSSLRENFIRNFNFAREDSSEVTIDPRKFVKAISELKDKLYQTRY